MPVRALVASIAMGLLISSCRPASTDPGSNAESDRDGSPPIARVGPDRITADDLNLESAGSDPKRQLDVAIARKLASAEALDRKLDQQPDIAAKLDAIRRDAARAEEEALRDALFASLRDAVVLSDEDLRAHYEKTKLRFSERQWRFLRQRFASESEAQTADAKLGATEHLDAAHADTIGPASGAEIAAATSPEVLRLQRPGQRAVVARDGGYELVELVEILPAESKPFETVRPQVEASLRTLRAQAAFRAEIERLRAAAKIEIDAAALAASASASPAKEAP